MIRHTLVMVLPVGTRLLGRDPTLYWGPSHPLHHRSSFICGIVGRPDDVHRFIILSSSDLLVLQSHGRDLLRDAIDLCTPADVSSAESVVSAWLDNDPVIIRRRYYFVGDHMQLNPVHTPPCLLYVDHPNPDGSCRRVYRDGYVESDLIDIVVPSLAVVLPPVIVLPPLVVSPAPAVSPDLELRDCHRSFTVLLVLAERLLPSSISVRLPATFTSSLLSLRRHRALYLQRTSVMLRSIPLLSMCDDVFDRAAIVDAAIMRHNVSVTAGHHLYLRTSRSMQVVAMLGSRHVTQETIRQVYILLAQQVSSARSSSTAPPSTHPIVVARASRHASEAIALLCCVDELVEDDLTTVPPTSRQCPSILSSSSSSVVPEQFVAVASPRFSLDLVRR